MSFGGSSGDCVVFPVYFSMRGRGGEGAAAARDAMLQQPLLFFPCTFYFTLCMTLPLPLHSCQFALFGLHDLGAWTATTSGGMSLSVVHHAPPQWCSDPSERAQTVQARSVSCSWVCCGIIWHALLIASHILLKECFGFRYLRLRAPAADQVPCRLFVWVPLVSLSPL